MNVNSIIAESISRSTGQVFSTMVGVEIGAGRPFGENTAPQANEGVVSFIGLAGAWAGTGSLSCSPELACRICAQMLLCEATAVNEEVLDAVAELTNMIIGGVKNDLEQHVGPLGLSIPTVVYGAADPKAGAVRTLYNLLDDPRLNHRCQIVPGVLAEPCGQILSQFFQQQRRLGKK